MTSVETILWDQIVVHQLAFLLPSDDDGPVHLQLDDDSGKDATSDGNISGEWALLVNVCALTSLKIFKRKLKIESLKVHTTQITKP